MKLNKSDQKYLRLADVCIQTTSALSTALLPLEALLSTFYTSLSSYIFDHCAGISLGYKSMNNRFKLTFKIFFIGIIFNNHLIFYVLNN